MFVLDLKMARRIWVGWGSGRLLVVARVLLLLSPALVKMGGSPELPPLYACELRGTGFVCLRSRWWVSALACISPPVVT